MKKVLLVLSAVVVLICTVWYLAPKPVTDLYAPGKYCPFCDAKVLDRQKFYEDDLVIGMCTYRPIAPGHCLVIPKRHVQRFEQLSDEEMLRISQVLKKVNSAAAQIYGNPAYLLLQKNGFQAGQSVPHVHFHYLPRQGSEGSMLSFFIQSFMANVLPSHTPEEMRPTIEAMHELVE